MMAKKAALFGDTATELSKRFSAEPLPASTRNAGIDIGTTSFSRGTCTSSCRIQTCDEHSWKRANYTFPRPAHTTSFGASATQPTTHSLATHRVGEDGIRWAEF